MAGPAKWDWSASNGGATAQQTIDAHTALLNNGRTAAFSYLVWNDIIDKISAQRQFWTDTAWDESVLSKANAKMTSGAQMTAARFNSAVKNMPPIKTWPWQETLGRTNIHPLDRCYGVYFIYLTDGLNYWIDLIPLPFEISNVATTSILMASHVLPALHIKVNSLNSTLTHNVKVHPAPAAHIRYSLSINQGGTLYVSTLNAANIRILSFFNTSFRTGVTMYPTAHIIGELNAALSHSASVTFGNCDFISVHLPFSFAAAESVHLAPSDPVAINLDVGDLDIATTISAAQRTYLAFHLVATLQGEPWIRELDSVPINAVLDILGDPTVTVTCQDMEYVIASIMTVFAGALKLVCDRAIRVRVQTAMSASFSTKVSVSDIVNILASGEIAGFDVIAKLFAVGSTATGASLTDYISVGAALVVIDRLLVAADLTDTFTQSATLSFQQTCHVISDMLHSVLFSADADVLESRHVISSLVETLSFLAGTDVMSSQHVATDLSDLLLFGSKSVVMTGVPLASDLRDAFDLRVGFRATSHVYAAVDLYLEHLLRIRAQAANMLHSGADLSAAASILSTVSVNDLLNMEAVVSGAFSTGIIGRLVPPVPAKVEMPILHTVNPARIIARSPDYAAGIITSITNFRAKVLASQTTNSAFILSAIFAGDATVSVLSRLNIPMLLQMEHAGSYDITLAILSTIRAVIGGIFSVGPVITGSPSLPTSWTLQINQAMTTAIKLATLTLASEIDDVLASDLDGLLVTEVEFTIR